MGLKKSSSYLENVEGGEDEWKQTFDEWKQELVAEDRILTESQIKVELLQAGTTSVLALLQSPMVNIENIKKQVKVNYLKASRRLAGLSLL